MATIDDPADDPEGVDPVAEARSVAGSNRSLAPQPGRADGDEPDDAGDGPAPDQSQQSQQ